MFDKEENSNLDLIEEYINDNRWSSKSMNDHSQMFFFSSKEKDDKICVGNGSEEDHFNVCMTSYALLLSCDSSNQNNVTMYGIDGTYKIVKEQHVLVCFGRLDMVRCYHPVAFMLTSHESHADYVYFYRSMSMIVAALNIPLTIPYLMQDASKAEYAGIKSVYPNVFFDYVLFSFERKCSKKLV